jgi:GH24 family phage-related lysozyme (muramidase)
MDGINRNLMKKSTWYWVGGVALLIALFMTKNWKALAASVIAYFESFSATPYWDVSRWSWGYGTQAPGPTGTITRVKAMFDLQAHAQQDYNYLAPRITRALTANQWAALLSFSYNEGPGNASNLVSDINGGDDAALEVHWKKYIFSRDDSGALVVNSGLVTRRAKEWSLWSKNIL